MSKRLASCMALLLSAAVAAAAKTPDVAKHGAKCRQGSQKGCAELVKLAMTPPFINLGRDAVAQITDQAALIRIAKEADSLEVRRDAVAKVTDQQALAAFAEEFGLREHAIRNLTDQKLLFEVANNDRIYPHECRAAAARVTDQALLAELAFKHKDAALRLDALKRLTDAATLARLGSQLGAPGSPTGFEESAIAAQIATQLTDQALLADLARTAPSSDMRGKARARLTDPAVLAELVIKSEGDVGSDGIRDIVKLGDQSRLAEVATNARSAGARAAALQKLKDPALLARIAKSDADQKVRAAALKRAAAVKRNVVVSGTLVEKVLGQPVSDFVLVLGAHGNALVADAVTDGEGRFSMEAVETGDWDLRHDGLTLKGPKGYVHVPVPATGKVDLGRVEIQEDRLVAAALAPVCETEKPPAHLPEGDVLVFQHREKEPWEHSYDILQKLAWTPPWKAAVCITTTSTQLGRYVDQKGMTAGVAYATHWAVRVVRLQDGHVLKSEFAARPPEQTAGSAYGAFGDPTSRAAAWLKTIQ